MAINIVWIMSDTLYKKGIFDKDTPIKWQISFVLISMCCLIFERLSMTNEEEIVVGLLHFIKEY